MHRHWRGFGRSGLCRHCVALVVLRLLITNAGWAQSWDPGVWLADTISEAAGGKLKLAGEFRVRYEDRTSNYFGRDTDIATGLLRSRLGLSYTPVKWLKLSAMMQDARAPGYGENAPNTVRDPADLQEAYIELFPGYRRGVGLTAGRLMLNYGDGRLLGTPQWGNMSRTYDSARIYYRLPKAQLELLFTSIVKVRVGEFNRPALGDRLWGTYNAFPEFYGKNLLEVYFLRREQNRPGGFTGGSQAAGTDRLGINTLGFRAAGPLSGAAKYTLEAAVQNGKVGPARLHAQALVANVTRRWGTGKTPLDVTAEYKYASGTRDPSDPGRSGTFDQLYAANHDRFGHQDLFGWRNIHNARALATLGVTRSLAVNFMYGSFWLASVKDAIYNGSGRLIAQSRDGTAGRHVGEEADLFLTYKYQHFTWGTGYGRFAAGGFIRHCTAGVGPTYVYVFQSYAF